MLTEMEELPWWYLKYVFLHEADPRKCNLLKKGRLGQMWGKAFFRRKSRKGTFRKTLKMGCFV